MLPPNLREWVHPEVPADRVPPRRGPLTSIVYRRIHALVKHRHAGTEAVSPPETGAG